MQLTNAIDFLMWSYFNLTIGDCNKVDRILHICIQKAYDDATQQGAYNAMIPKDNNDLKNRSQKAEIQGGKAIKKAIDQLLINGETEFDHWHESICDSLVKIYEDNGINHDKEILFSYGNSQKWVNMTLKYVYILYWIYQSFSDSSDFCKKYEKVVETCSKYFHIPVDSFMIQKFWDMPDIFLPLKDGAGRKKDYKNPQDHVKPWSTWAKEDDYQKLQKSLRKNPKFVFGDESPIDWEGPAWIAIAQNRKAKELVELEKRYNENE